MTYKIIINEKDNVNNVFVYENNNLVEQYKEDIHKQRLEGNIYLGRVKDVIKGMQSAFVDIGEERNALIHLKDIVPKESNITGNDKIDILNYNMTNYIKQNENILVQVKRDGYKEKGAKVTKDIKLVGKYTILMPLSRFITVSTRIESNNEKQRLKNNTKKICNDLNWKGGIIVRTSAQNIEYEEIKKDIKILMDTWNEIIIKSRKVSAPQLLYTTNGIIGKLIKDFEPIGVEIIANTEELKEKLQKKYARIKISVNKDIKDEVITPKKVWLKCGGFITIDITEALIAIDVNSGKYKGKKGLEDTVYKVNKEAAEEIAKQLRLHDLGGIIIIDFINMNREEDRENITKIFSKELKNDRSKVQIVEFTKLGLLELTRKNIYRK